MRAPRPFRVAVSDAELDWIRDRVAAYRWHEMPQAGGWEFGTNLDYMRQLCRHWLDAYDWREAERGLNRFPQVLVAVDGLDIHAIVERGSGPAPLPLVLMHGWPGSVFEFLHLIAPLAHPERFGGDARDAFDVIVPSLPGYGFSGKPARPIGPRRIAGLINGLMTQGLGYDHYLAQGGDWGSAIATWIGIDHAPPCVAIHLNMFGTRPDAHPETGAEKEWAACARRTFRREGAYYRQQATRPQTLSYAMMDSPVGAAAWIVEKFHRWSDIRDDDIESCYTKDQLLTNVMITLVSRTFNTASWLYRGLADEGSGSLAPGQRVEVPVAAACFPGEFIPWPPRSYAEKAYNITRWTEMARGGHFAALEQPDLLAGDIRAFARTLR